MSFIDSTVNDSITTTPQSVVLDVRRHAAATVTLTGTWSGTIQFEATTDNVTWVSVLGAPVPSGSSVTSTTANGTWLLNVAAFASMRLRSSAWTSGTAAIAVRASIGTLPPFVPASIVFTNASGALVSSIGVTPAANGSAPMQVRALASTAAFPTNQGLRTSTLSLFDNDPTNNDNAVVSVYQELQTNPGGTIKKSGFHSGGFVPPDNGGESSRFFAEEAGGGCTFTGYKVAGNRKSGYPDFSYSPQGASEFATDGGSHAVFGVVGLQIFNAITSTTTTASAGTTPGSLAVTDSTQLPTPGAAKVSPLTGNYPATLYARLSDGTNTEWIAYTAVPDSTHITTSVRGLGGSTAFNFASGAVIRVQPRATAGWFRIDDGVSDGILITDNRGTYEIPASGTLAASKRFAFAIGNKVVGGAPSAPRFSIDFSGRMGWYSGQNTCGFTTVGAAGAAAALPAAPVGYFVVKIDEAVMKVPYYNS